ncbi:MAG TPA: hypothetical protein VJ144_09615 [Candidatus Polarisedimenticolia bacterium]|nr:hypothetical protein [Candidatus Polarisedimenticolia bacterium]
MIIQALALLALVLALWTVFRFAMGLRWAKLSREDARAAEQARGRRVVAEIPLSDDDIVFFVEDEAGFYWGGRQARKRDIRGARLLLNGAVMASFSRDGEPLPERQSAPAFDDEGREKWEIVLYLRGGRDERVACGSLREGVSREIAARVFEAVRSAVEGGKT